MKKQYGDGFYKIKSEKDKKEKIDEYFDLQFSVDRKNNRRRIIMNKLLIDYAIEKDKRYVIEIIKIRANILVFIDTNSFVDLNL
jgi:hypothetical protein